MQKLSDTPYEIEWLHWVGRIWALPNTLLGIVLGLTGRARWQIVSGAIEILLQKGPVAKCCRYLGISAFTLGDCVLYCVVPCDNLRAHEGRHIRQYWLLGPFFLPVYFIGLGVWGYANHPLERDARLWELRKCHRLYTGQIGQPPDRAG